MRVMRRHDLTNKKTLTKTKTMKKTKTIEEHPQRTILRVATFETLITFLTISSFTETLE